MIWPTLLHYPAMLVLTAAFAQQLWNLLGALQLYRATLHEAGLH